MKIDNVSNHLFDMNKKARAIPAGLLDQRSFCMVAALHTLSINTYFKL